MAKKEQNSEIVNVVQAEANVKNYIITIEGSSELILNKMTRKTENDLAGARLGLPKDTEPANPYEDLVTSVHWHATRDEDLPQERSEFTEETLSNLLTNDLPCITKFGLKKSFNEAVVRNNIDKYSTKFNATVNIAGPAYIPVKFSGHHVERKLMQPKKGAPVLVHQNVFDGWTAEFEIAFTENAYTLEQIAQIINLAGFGGGIGSGRSSGYGRYQIVDIQPA